MAAAHWLDYCVFSLIMLVSLATGIYFSFRQQGTEDYLYGRRKMALLPVSASLVVSFISAITMQGVPAEVYVYGIQYCVIVLNIWGMWLAAVTFVPLYHPLKLTSVYQYLDMRFNSKALVVLGYAMGICTANVFMGLILYGPATALESMIGIPTWVNIIGISVVCTIYTSIGGMKAVVWNDTFQAFIMVAGLLVVIIAGCVKVGGPGQVWFELERRERTNLSLSPDPTLRVTLWFGFITFLSSWGLYSNQPAMMRYEALPTIRKAQYSVIIGSMGHVGIQLLAAMAGAVVLAYYSKVGCEPMATGEINSPNQILPYFLVDVLGMPGVPGLFIAAVVAASLSSISSVQNAMAAVFWKEIALPLMGEVSDLKETLMLKLIVVFFGCISTAIAFAAKYIGGTLVQISMLVLSVTDAPPIGLFFLGAAFTFTSGLAGFIACVSSVLICTSLHLGRVFTGTTWPTPPLINDTCPLIMNNYTNISSRIALTTDLYYTNISTLTPDLYYTSYNNITTESSSLSMSSDDWTIFRLSPYLYSTLGTSLTIIIGLLLSLFPCCRYNKPVQPNLLFPYIRRCLFRDRGLRQLETMTESKESLTEKEALMETERTSEETL